MGHLLYIINSYPALRPKVEDMIKEVIMYNRYVINIIMFVHSVKKIIKILVAKFTNFSVISTCKNKAKLCHVLPSNILQLIKERVDYYLHTAQVETHNLTF